MVIQEFKWKPALRNALTFGIALEIAAIAGGYYLYREYKTNTEFRDKVDEQFPELTQMYRAVSGMYLNVMPKQVKEKLLTESKENATPAAPSLETTTGDKSQK